MTRTDVAAVAVRTPAGGASLVDHSNPQPGGAQVVGAGNADDPRADDQDIAISGRAGHPARYRKLGTFSMADWLGSISVTATTTTGVSMR